ncbi:hypothetical protein LOK49_LG09G02338 [Camellia lanceoleosa]|uniref:Uncharacterized protein n=1 Tax=Camellia lanceoleosa TaxID=1840588 RepID=A0ACC0GJR5_9ERIC|nr:hypothetical protein LOK49_LG09G02338 [Camellia lanceoleosa]
MEAISSTFHHHIPTAQHPSPSTTTNQLPQIHAHHQLTIDTQPNPKTSNRSIRLAESLSHLFHLHIEPPTQKHVHSSIWNVHFDHEERHNTPAMSPKEDISDKWREKQDFCDRQSFEPTSPLAMTKIVKYGEFASLIYDAFDFDSFLEYCGSCRYNRDKIFDKLGLTKHGYKVSKYIYAMSQKDVPRWLGRDKANKEEGYSRMAWRGTVVPSEWYEDLQRKLEPIGEGEAKVEYGFLSIYISKSDVTRYNKSSALEQVMKEVK